MHSTLDAIVLTERMQPLPPTRPWGEEIKSVLGMGRKSNKRKSESLSDFTTQAVEGVKLSDKKLFSTYYHCLHPRNRYRKNPPSFPRLIERFPELNT